MIQPPVNHTPAGQHPSAGETGFTLIELIVTMAIAGILLTVAVPSFQTTIANNRLTTQTNSLVTDINIARSEAVKRGTSIVLCNSSNANAAAPICTGNGNAWSSGWLVFFDNNGDNAFVTTDGDTLIKVGQASGGSATILTANTLNAFAYNGDGTSAAATNVNFFICDDRGETFGRQVQIRLTGRPRLISGPLPASACTPT
jgi:type IV fimbrial biogenesis protein FimT